MLSDITIKYSAITQINMYNRLNQFANNHHPLTTTPLALSIIVTDIFIDTLKVPMASIENTTFALINLSTAAFLENARLIDASQNVRKAIGGILVTPLALLISPIKLISQLCLVLPNLKDAKSCNKEACMEAKFESIYTPCSYSDRNLQAV